MSLPIPSIYLHRCHVINAIAIYNVTLLPIQSLIMQLDYSSPPLCTRYRSAQRRVAVRDIMEVTEWLDTKIWAPPTSMPGWLRRRRHSAFPGVLPFVFSFVFCALGHFLSTSRGASCSVASRKQTFRRHRAYIPSSYIIYDCAEGTSW